MKKNRKKIAYLGHGLYYGGATTSLYLLIKSIDNNEYEKNLYITSCKSEQMKKDFLKHCEKIELIKMPHIYNDQAGGRTSLLSFYLKKLYKPKALVGLLKKEEIDILHVNSSVFPHVHKFIKKHSNIKIVTHVREMIPKYGFGIVQKYMINQIMKYSDAIITISDNEAQNFIGHPNLHIIPNPFDFSKIDKIQSTFREDNQIKNETVLVGMMGQFHKSKGHFDFLKALKIIIDRKETKYPFLFVLLGIYPQLPIWKRVVKRLVFRSNYRQEVLKYIKDNNIGEHVMMVPYSYEVFNILEAIDIIVRPSLAGDPWGRDIIESMACSKPIVATGTSDFFIKDGLSGYLIPSGHPEKIAEKVIDLINDSSLRNDLGKQGYLKVRAMCDISEYGVKIAQIYKSLLNNKELLIT